MGAINTRVVRRSAALHAQWQQPYGPDFRYQEYTKFDPPLAWGKAALVTGLMALYNGAMDRAPTRHLLKSLLPKPGSGPSEQTMNTGWFTTEWWAWPPTDAKRALGSITKAIRRIVPPCDSSASLP
jgi:short subunit dehydrogenase-like uncharacterized protein